MRFDPLSVDVPRLLIALGIQAEHQGDRWIARCPSPDHPDRSPSWDIKDEAGQPRHGCHHCLACKFQGTATELVADLLGISFSGARDFILERAMGAAPIVQSFARQSMPGAGMFRLPPEVVVAPLPDWPETARRYAISRDLTAEQVRRWRLGYAVSGRLAGRIIMPAYDPDGTPLHYTARTFAGHAKRYLEPKRQEGAAGGVIFGEQHWPVPQDRDVVCITEGAFNALAVERVAARLPLASLFGSNIELQHLGKLTSFKAALVLTDPDPAGDRAAEKLYAALSRDLRLERVTLPKPDRDSTVKVDADTVGPDVLRESLVQAWRRLRNQPDR